MKSLLILLILVISTTVFSCQGEKEKQEDACVIETSLGTMEFRFFEQDAPQTVAHIKNLVKSGFYNGKVFYRVVKGHVIQTGDQQDEKGKTVKAEFNKNPHLEGTVGLARGDNPDSGSNHIYICLAPRPHLDGKYTVFGQLISGIDVLKKIGQVQVIEKFLGEQKNIAFHEPKEKIFIKKMSLKTIN
jgi:cyclophilin family peptidyl-prolyl cis-trans isomerase